MNIGQEFSNWSANGPIMRVTLSQAVDLLDRGQVVAIPTETVYGLAADAANDEALTLLYQTKGRPSDHPVILHVADAAMCEPYVQEIGPAARALMTAFWPGPLTILLTKTSRVSERITGGRPNVGVRAPATSLTQSLLRKLGRPLVAPSANRFGHISPTSADHVEQEFEGQVPVLDGGECQVGVESTIVAVENDRILVLRPGQLSSRSIAEIAGLPVVEPEVEVQGVPGSLKSHYAPTQPVTLLSADDLSAADVEGAAVVAITPNEWPRAKSVRHMPSEAHEYARNLYSALRDAEASGADRILIEMPPAGPDWGAVRDRMSRAAAR